MKKKVFLDGYHTAVISVNEDSKTVIAELESEDENELIYAEKFNKTCNFEKEAIKAVIAYLKNSFDGSVIKSISSYVSAMIIMVICSKSL